MSPEDEDKPAPGALRLVQGFVNTLDRDLGTDALASDEEAVSWLAESGLLDGARRAAVSPADLDLARDARESIRTMIAGEPLTEAAMRPLGIVTASAAPVLAVTADGRVLTGPLAPARTVSDALGALLLIIRDAQRDGTWSRLKICANPECRWAFYDRSHPRRGQWCDMSTCGNRMKNRSLRARKRA